MASKPEFANRNEMYIAWDDEKLYDGNGPSTSNQAFVTADLQLTNVKIRNDGDTEEIRMYLSVGLADFPIMSYKQVYGRKKRYVPAGEIWEPVLPTHRLSEFGFKPGDSVRHCLMVLGCARRPGVAVCVFTAHVWFQDLTLEPDPSCCNHRNSTECQRAGCHWWSDGTCHDTSESPCTVTCDTDECPNKLGITSGCELLLRYDCNGDGSIYLDGYIKANDDARKGLITEDEWYFILGTWQLDRPNINEKCPGCYVDLKCSPEGAHEILEYCPDGITEKRWRDCIDGTWVDDFRSCPVCIEGEKDVIEYCPDGSTWKRWWECIEGEWKHKSQTCPPVEGDRKCVNFDLYEYQSGEWVLIEEHSMTCIKCPFAVIAQGTDLVDFLGPVREFRDTVLKQSYAGRKFISIYYNKLTPSISPILLRHALLKRAIRPFVRPVVWLVIHKKPVWGWLKRRKR